MNSYKISIAVLFGLVGLILNFNSIKFSFPPYTAVIFIGLLCSIIVSMTFGWKYGGLSGIICCTSIWWMLVGANGYAIFFVVFPFILWVMWHGYFAELRMSRGGGEWWLSPYVVEIPFRILNTINLYTITRWAVGLNPPSWAITASSTVPIEFTYFVIIKQCLCGYIVLLLADVLLNLEFIRNIFRLDKKSNQTKTSHIISAAVLFGVFFWFIDSIIGSLAFYNESSFIDLLAMDIPPYVFYVRTAFIIACLIGGLVAASFLRKQHESEDALRKSVLELERSNTDLTQFAYVASHDLKEPLRVVSGYMNVIKRRYEGKLDTDADGFIDSMLDGVDRMQNLIDDLLLYSRAGVSNDSLEVVECDSVLDDALSNLEVSIEDSGALITRDPMPIVTADCSQLNQVFQNLIGNAIKFSGDDQPRIHISVEKKGDEFVFSVSDNGIGIEHEFFDQVFVVFKRLHGREEYSGTGIGLAICKKIVEQHGGRMWLESEVGVGSTFYFTL